MLSAIFLILAILSQYYLRLYEIKKSTLMRGFFMSKQEGDLDVEQEVHHVAIFNDVVFTF